MFVRKAAILAAAIAAASAAPASAKILKYHAMLDGNYGSEPSHSPATGRATIRVDTATHRVSVDLTASGITVDQ